MSSTNPSSIRFLSCLGILLTGSLCSFACATPEKGKREESDKEGWTLIGPFDNPQAPDGSCPGFLTDFLESYGGEAGFGALGESALPAGLGRKIEAEKESVDFLAAFPGSTWRVAYAYREFESEGGDFALRVGSDDGVRLWLNGELVLDHHVHRSVNPNDEAFRATLLKGRNRVLIKVCQGTGDWGAAFRVSSLAEEEALLAKTVSLGLAIAAPDSIREEAEKIEFCVSTQPVLALGFPIAYKLEDSRGKLLAQGEVESGRVVVLALPAEARGMLRLRTQAGRGLAPETERKLTGASAHALFVRGDATAVFSSMAERARAVARDYEARRIASGSGSGSGSGAGVAPTDVSDIAPTLLFLADRLEGKLEASLVGMALRMKALDFTSDLLEALEAGREGELRGYRQMAYRSVIDDSVQPYSLYVPASYDPATRYGLVVALHGYSGEDYSGGEFLAKLAPQDFLIASAYGRGDMHYKSLGEQDVLDLMDRISTRYSIDPDRVYLTGISMGGLGTWRLGELYPDRFAAIAPICGWTGKDWLPNLRNVKTFVIHGDADTSVPVGMDRQAVAELKRLGYSVRYDELPGIGHGAWSGWIRDRPPESFLDFFRSCRRATSPDRVTARIPYARYGRQYWIGIEELDCSGKLSIPASSTPDPRGGGEAPLLPMAGSVDAQRVSRTRLAIKTERVLALRIDLALAGMDPTATIEIGIDGTKLSAQAGAASISLKKRKDGAWRAEDSNPREGVFRHEGGGLADLFTKSLVIVYGTKDPARAPVLEAAARRLADWSWTEQIPIGVKIGSFRVKADIELSEEDISSRELLLLGRPSENIISERIGAALAPYYSGGAIAVSGERYERRGLALLLPSPLAEGRLLGYLDLPPDFLPSAAEAVDWCRFFPFRIRNIAVNESATYPGFCPDLMVLTRNPLRDDLSLWRDKDWELP